MPYAVTHFLIALVLVGLFRDYFVKDKRKFPLPYVLLGGIAGVLPDVDVGVYYVLSFFGFAFDEVHRTFSHSLFFPLLFLFLGILSYGFKNRKLGLHHLCLRNIFFVLAFGTFIHLVLDGLIAGVIMPFYPFSYSPFGLNWVKAVPLAWQDTFLASVDAVLLIIWISYLEWKHRISDFI